ncbi:homeobox transcription factor [Grosmannia clavigera kw1407]|uniref:Homeobox transcription factor n=1 Tax=Grosmannia clavigera (strain kw1407 / UAMH 11150) TaxID=655863 RepID=F0XGZ1_GROCL|nr:homeobox transcription factor [Grosmannia clavigera kw1407]EFX02949.1 homeobox transcription factor [Grosmannia clavigera kw1407]
MSLLAMSAPALPHTSFRRGLPWDSDTRAAASDFTLSRSRVDLEQIALPSIRQAIPELQLRVADNQPSVSVARPTLAPSGPPSLPSMPSPNANTSEYVHSPSSSYKRQRVSVHDDRSERFSQVPRLCAVPPHLERPGPLQRAAPAGASPTLGPLRSATSASASPPISSASSATTGNTVDGWRGSDSRYLSYGHREPERTSDRLLETAPGGGSSSSSSSSNGSSSIRGLPGLPQLRFDRDPAPISQLRTSYPGDSYASAPTASNDGYRYQQHGQSPTGPSSSGGHGIPYGPPSYQHHPSRMQSLSLGSIRGFDRAAFPSSSSGGNTGNTVNSSGNSMRYGGHHNATSPTGYHHEYVPVGEWTSSGNGGLTSGVSGGATINGAGDTKQRKRRGNLPKETTDKLRAWFVAHLNHPYPSEDEKQELMRQTGLQMNQISNWFINARRRQLPAMINNARVESDAMLSSRGSSGSRSGGVTEISPRSYSGGSSLHHGGSKVLPSTEHMLLSPERSLAPRTSALYGAVAAEHQVSKHDSPMSEDDYDDLSRHRSHIKRGSV